MNACCYKHCFCCSGSIVCSIGLFGFGALHWVTGHTSFLAAAILLRILSASGESIIGPAAYTLATRQMALKHRSKALAIAETAFGSGFMLGPPLGGVLYDLGGFYTPFWTNASCLLVVGLGGLYLLQDQPAELAVTEEPVRWWAVVRCPRVLVGFFTLLASGTSGQWFAATLEPYLAGRAL
jgi:MFS family permease